jgi:hypothetical protein
MEIEPCPHCSGEGRLHYAVTYRVRCQSCDAMGPPGVTRQIAIDGWNKREKEIEQ